MNLMDLQVFLTVVRTGTLQRAALELHRTPSTLSRSIKRLEQSLSTPLFERAGKRLSVNADGMRLLERAKRLQRQVEDTRAEFLGGLARTPCRIIGPAVLLGRHAAAVSAYLDKHHPNAALALQVAFEDAALQAVARGEADFALVTESALKQGFVAGMASAELTPITMQLAAGPSHVLCARGEGASDPAPAPKWAEVRPYPFACPGRSWFGGLERGHRADGWRDDQLSRRIRFWVDDMHVLLSLVRDGHALAYLPDTVIKDNGLVHLPVVDCEYRCVESIHAAWRPGHASGWHGGVLEVLRSSQLR